MQRAIELNGVAVANVGEILSPFRGEQTEIGAKYDAGTFGGSISLFRTTQPAEYFEASSRRYTAGGEQENQGVELTDIAQVFQKSGTTQVSWKDSGITKVDDFEGKRIGSWGFGNEWEIFAAMADKGLDASTVKITTQDFSMNALLDKDVDAAQAMTYNELAQLLETVNPATGKLYTMDDINVISYEDTAGAMLQDAIWADTKRLSDDPAYADAARSRFQTAFGS